MWVALRVFVALVQHIVNVIERLGELNFIHPQVASSPGRHVRLTGVVGGQRGDHVAVELVDQVVEVEGPVADVDVRIGKVLELEGLSSAQLFDEVGSRRVICISPRAPASDV